MIKKILISLFLLSATTLIFLLNVGMSFSEGIELKPIISYEFDGNFLNSIDDKFNAILKGNVELNNDGVSNSCADFKGGYLEVTDSENLNLSQNLTISMWIKMDKNLSGENNYTSLFSKKSDNKINDIINLEVSGLGTIFYNHLFEESYNQTCLNDRNNFFDNWNHVAIVENKNEIKCFVNGEETICNSKIGTDLKLISSNQKIRIGLSDNNLYRGKIDKFYLYNISLSNDQVKYMFNNKTSIESSVIQKSMDINLQNPSDNLNTPTNNQNLKSKNNEISFVIGEKNMKVNDETEEIDPGRDTVPVIESGRTLLPVRTIIEKVGGKVYWDGDKRKVKIKYNLIEIELTIDKKDAYINGIKRDLDVAPIIINGRTMLPIRFIAENLGLSVEWYDEEKKVKILY